MMTTNHTFPRLTRVDEFSSAISPMNCLIYRCIALVFVVGAVLTFYFNVYLLAHHRHRFNALAISLIFNSIFLMFVSLPYILIQASRCAPIDSDRFCHFQGFICYTCGISVMYTMTLMAFVQYIRLFHQSSSLYRLLEDRNNFFLPLICWAISLLWSFPPFINVKPGFTREGPGFDCGLNWRSNDISSRLYLFLAFLFIYFLPLFSLITTNVRILFTIRRLIYHRRSFIGKSTRSMSINSRHRLSDLFTVAESNRLKRLRIDRRFAQATMITVLHYLIAWTPYASGGILQIVLSIKQSPYEPPGMLLTASALIAKLAVIGQACVYYYTVRPSKRRQSLTSATLK